MQIGIVGLGRMGAGMARRVARAGVPVLYGVPSWLPHTVVRGQALIAAPLVLANAEFELRDVSDLLRAAAAADQPGTK